jgi:hypothetical protein
VSSYPHAQTQQTRSVPPPSRFRRLATPAPAPQPADCPGKNAACPQRGAHSRGVSGARQADSQPRHPEADGRGTAQAVGGVSQVAARANATRRGKAGAQDRGSHARAGQESGAPVGGGAGARADSASAALSRRAWSDCIEASGRACHSPNPSPDGGRRRSSARAWPDPLGNLILPLGPTGPEVWLRFRQLTGLTEAARRRIV